MQTTDKGCPGSFSGCVGHLDRCDHSQGRENAEHARDRLPEASSQPRDHGRGFLSPLLLLLPDQSKSRTHGRSRVAAFREDGGDRDGSVVDRNRIAGGRILAVVRCLTAR
jgi:hypothetical protein